MRLRSRHRSTFPLCAAALVLACSGAPGAPDRQPVAGVQVQPQNATVVLGGAQAFTATVLDSEGRPLIGRSVFWASEDESIAVVSSIGVVSATGVGSTRIAASAEGRFAYAQVQVSPRPVHSVQIVPSSSETTVNGTIRLRAIGYDELNNELTGRAFVWASSNESVASVVQGPTPDSAVVTGHMTGAATISATSEARTGNAAVAISAIPVQSVTVSSPVPPLLPGETHQLTAAVRAADGTVLNRQVTWSSNSPGVAVVNSDGLVTAVAPGVATITAQVEGVAGTANVTVNQAPVASVSLTAPRTDIRIGEQIQVVAVLRDAANNVLTDRPISWSTTNPAVATVSATGVVSAVGTGSATITATSEDQSGTLIFSVTPRPVGSVVVAPASTALLAGQTQQLSATVQDTAGQVLSGRTVSWSSSNDAVASVDPGSGLVTAHAQGSVTITATSEGQSGQATVNVSPVPVATVEVSNDGETLVVGSDIQLTVTVRDADGSVLLGRDVLWSSSDVAIAIVSADGLVSGVNAGALTISATVEGVQGDAALTVVDPDPEP